MQLEETIPAVVNLSNWIIIWTLLSSGGILNVKPDLAELGGNLPRF